ncbi:uncharacterized protein J3D65DRAFT_657864 [Phyllosticta citribraziliensis]|uniref:Uncharacterized protein n=1 Tax=Phyllosticta citribraziliensis TaxID=989973 RepID=A0ABR1LT55_9PEZI
MFSHNMYSVTGDEMDIEPSSADSSPGDTTTTKSGRQINPPKRYADETFPTKGSPEQPTSTPKVSPKRSAEEELESPDSGKKSKLNTGEGQSRTPFAQHQQQQQQQQQQQPRYQFRERGGPSGNNGGKNSYGFVGVPGRGSNEGSWRPDSNKDETNKGNEKPMTAQTSQAARQQRPEIKGGMIIHGRHYSKYLRQHRPAPSVEEQKHITQITDGSGEEVYCKKRYHIVLRTQSNHIITVPLYSKKAGLMTQDPVLLHEYLQVVKKGYNGTVRNPTHNNEVVLRVQSIYGHWVSSFLENGHPVSWAHFLEPHSVHKKEDLQVVGELEPDSYNQLMNLFSTYFSANPLPVQAQTFGNP